MAAQAASKAPNMIKLKHLPHNNTLENFLKNPFLLVYKKAALKAAFFNCLLFVMHMKKLVGFVL